MSLFVSTTASNRPEWVRQVATAINNLLRKRGSFPSYSNAPPDPEPGDGYFDTALSKARVWDGTAWNNLW